MKKAVFLDRDGTLNKSFFKNGSPVPPREIKDFEILSDAKKSILTLKKLNFLCILVTNQPDVARGTIEKKTVLEMNYLLMNEVNLDDIFICYHDDDDDCDCRKPKPGLLKEAKKKWNINMSCSYMIGDRWRDIQVGINAGCKTIFIDNKWPEINNVIADFSTHSLTEAVNFIKKDNL